MIAALLTAAAAAISVDPCAPVPPGDADITTALVYSAVGESELNSGAVESAAIAFREALRRDPANTRALAGMSQLCQRSTTPADPFDAGVRLMDAGERRAAIPFFIAARKDGPDPHASLLEGICHYELGEETEARRTLEEALHTPQTHEQAAFFLGLMAYRMGHMADAADLFSAAGQSGDPKLQSGATELLRLSRGSRLGVSALAESGFDSNAQLAPDGAPAPGGNGDGFVRTVAALQTQPWGPGGPYFGGTGQYKQQLSQTAFNLASVGAVAGWGLAGTHLTATAEYAFDYLVLGGDPYLNAHRALARGQWQDGSFAAGMSYFARVESFLPDALDGYSGVRQQADLEATWQRGVLQLTAAYRFGRDDTRDPALSFIEHGPRAAAIVRLGAVRVGLESGGVWRAYDVPLEGNADARSDAALDGTLSGECALGDHWSVRAAVSGYRSLSNLPEFTYSKLVGSLGVTYALGLL